ncbi:MAG TPA: galactose oxidase-like domain-containing protein [Candidatus Eisenbacteria bacterium]
MNLVLLRGEYPYTAKIVWWQGDDQFGEVIGGQWGWKPGRYDCSTWPDTSFVEYTLPTPPGASIFCSGNAQMAEDGAKMFIPGGTVGAEDGVRDARIFTAGAGTGLGSWVSTDTAMIERRWYPTSTVLNDGRIIVCGGTKYAHLEVFGGRQDNTAPTSPGGDSLYRFGVVPGGEWDQAVRPPGLRPEPREGHTAVTISGADMVLFGGRRGTSPDQPLNDIWIMHRDNNVRSAEFSYSWSPPTVSGIPPRERSEHGAVVLIDNTTMVVFGGLGRNLAGNADSVYNDVWRLWLDTAQQPAVWTWSHMVTTGTAPSPRFGHAVVLDTTGSVGGTVSRGRMLVFGGIGAAGTAPTDLAIYALTFDPNDPNVAAWSQLTVSGAQGWAKPAPRYDHTMGIDLLTQFRVPGTSDTVLYAVMYGGRLSTQLNSTACSDTVWRLWLYDNLSVQWQPVTVQGTGPGRRAAQAGSYFAASRELYVSGGQLGDMSPADNFVYAVDVHADLESSPQTPTWQQWAQGPHGFANHTARFQAQYSFARVPEIYNPANGSWKRLFSSPLLQYWYPLDFVVPRGTQDTVRVVSVTTGSDSSYYLDLVPAGQTQNAPWRPLRVAETLYSPSSGVMYRPGRIMVAGGNGPSSVSGKTKTLRMATKADTANSWISSPDMKPRFNHNLVLLPTGGVLAVGGSGEYKNDKNNDPIYRPQIWTPIAPGDSVGTWTAFSESEGTDTLAANAVIRGYHSTAILLPDARVLCAGGNATAGGGCSPCDNSQLKANIFCPPYLFSGDTLATRPPVNGSPQRVRYGAGFSVCLAANQNIASVALIRPGAATHGFDQSQRYVPLSFTPVNYPTSSLVATAPADSSAAPPGDYLLFVVNTSGVPSIGRWVRMGASWPADDTNPPGQITNLMPDFLGSNSVTLSWTASGDDGASGTASYVDIRRSNSMINNDSDFNNATPVNQPVPACAGTGQIHLVTGLVASHTYYFAMKFVDESGNKSAMSNVVSATTVCSGCGGGERAGLAPEDEATSRGARAAGARAVATGGVAPPTTALTGAGTALIVEVAPRASGLDVSLIAVAGESYDGHALASGAGVLLKAPETDEVHSDLPAGDRFVLCTPERAARWVILEPCVVQQVLMAIRGQDAAWSLDEARHSRAGDVAALLAAGSPPPLIPGDTLELHYSAAADSVVPPSGWFLLLDRPSAGATLARAGGRRPETGSLIPASFALRQNQPNPFNARTTIRFELPVAAMVRMEVFDIQGRRLQVLADRFYAPGYHSVEWDKRTQAGGYARPGLYFYRIQAGTFRARRRMILLP